jgi:hypothetical protein
VLVTDGLAACLAGMVKLDGPNVHVLTGKGEPRGLLRLPQDELDRLRVSLLRPLGRRFEAPNLVALYLFENGSSVIENVNDAPVTVRLDGKEWTVAARSWLRQWR